jgi:hypothetical protein
VLLLGLANALAQPAKTPRIGFLYQTAGACKPDSRVEAFEGGLRDLGYIPGRTIIIDLRCHANHEDNMKTAAALASPCLLPSCCGPTEPSIRRKPCR